MKQEALRMESYALIKSVVMANDTMIEEVVFYQMPFLSDLTYEDGTVEEADIYLTKDSVIDEAGALVVTGFGTWSGKKVWQLPDEIKTQIEKTLELQEFLV